MKQIKRLVPALVGVLTAATVGLPQAAQAGTIKATSAVNFTDVTLKLIDNDATGDGIPNLWTRSQVQVDASGTINGVDPSDSRGPVACANTPIDTKVGNPASEFPFVLGTGTIDAWAKVDCKGVFANASNFASIDLTGNNIRGNAQGQYGVFSQNFTATGGDLLDLEGIFGGSLLASVTGPSGQGKVASAEFRAQYTVNRIVAGIATEVFAGQVFQAGVSVIDQIDTKTLDVGPIGIGFNDYTIGSGLRDDPNGGVYEVRLSAVENVTGRIDRKVPESSSLPGLLAVSGSVAFLKKRRNSH